MIVGLLPPVLGTARADPHEAAPKLFNIDLSPIKIKGLANKSSFLKGDLLLLSHIWSFSRPSRRQAEHLAIQQYGPVWYCGALPELMSEISPGQRLTECWLLLRGSDQPHCLGSRLC